MEKTVFNSIHVKKSLLQDGFHKKIRRSPMKLTYFELSIEESVAYLQVNHPPANTLNAEVIAELSSTINELESREDVKVIVLTGNENSLSLEQIFKNLPTLLERPKKQVLFPKMDRL